MTARTSIKPSVAKQQASLAGMKPASLPWWRTLSLADVPRYMLRAILNLCYAGGRLLRFARMAIKTAAPQSPRRWDLAACVLAALALSVAVLALWFAMAPPAPAPVLPPQVAEQATALSEVRADIRVMQNDIRHLDFMQRMTLGVMGSALLLILAALARLDNKTDRLRDKSPP